MGTSLTSRRRHNAKRRRLHRRQWVREMVAAGASVDEIAARLKVSRGGAQYHLRALGLRLSRAPRQAPRTGVTLFRYEVTAALARAGGPLATTALVLSLRPDDYRRGLRAVQQCLWRLRRAGEVRSRRAGRVTIWSLTGTRRLMTLEDAKRAILNGAPFVDVIDHLPPDQLEPLKAWYVREPGVPNLAARNGPAPDQGHAPPALSPLPENTAAARAQGYTGNLCPKCGSNMMVRSGASCEKCLNCGDSGGCG